MLVRKRVSMKNMFMRSAHAGWRAAIAGVLAASLAFAPLVAFAAGDEEEQAAGADMGTLVDAIGKIVAKDDCASATIAEAEDMDADVSDAGGEADGIEAGEEAVEYSSVTVYYCEIVLYDDPSFDHPSNLRLLDVATFDGVKVGEEIEEWDYVRDIPDFWFFDGWATNQVVSADPAQNTVQLHYSRVKSPSLVNYYAVTAAKGEGAASFGNAADADGAAWRFEKMGSYEIASQPLGTQIDADLLAVPLDDLVYLDSDKDEIVVEPLASNNEINLFYAPAAVTLPDDVEAGAAPDATQPENPGGGSDEDATGPSDGTLAPPTAEDTDAGQDDEASDEASGAPAGDETVIADDGAPLASAAEAGVLPLPQTGDEVVIGALLASAVLGAGGATLMARRRS